MGLEEALQANPEYWVSRKDDYVLVRQPITGDTWAYDVYRCDGTYASPSDEVLCRQVAERLLAVGVTVLDPDAWVLQQKVQNIVRRLARKPGEFLVVRQVGASEDSLYDQRANRYRAYEPDVERALIEHLVANGAEVVISAPCDITDDARSAWNQQVAQRYSEMPEHSSWIFGVLAMPSFEPWYAWRLLRHYGEDTWTYSAERITWRFGGQLPFREELRAASEHRWRFDLLEIELNLDRVEGDALVLHLDEIRVPPRIEEFPLGRDGTTYRLTAGDTRQTTEWTWWESGPNAWQELITFAFALYGRLHTVSACSAPYYGFGRCIML